MTSNRLEAIVVGGSAGALDALYLLLAALPRDLAVPVIVVLHLAPSGPDLLPTLLRDKSPLPVKEAEDKEPLAAGVVYVAPPDYHLLVERARTLALSMDAPVLFSRPSIDVLFESAADAFGPGLLGILLSGANDDGTRGFAAIKARGGRTIAQDPATAVVAAMPGAAIASGRVDEVLSPEALATTLGRINR